MWEFTQHRALWRKWGFFKDRKLRGWSLRKDPEEPSTQALQFPKFVGVLTGVLGPTSAEMKPDLLICVFEKQCPSWLPDITATWKNGLRTILGECTLKSSQSTPPCDSFPEAIIRQMRGKGELAVGSASVFIYTSF